MSLQDFALAWGAAIALAVVGAAGLSVLRPQCWSKNRKRPGGRRRQRDREWKKRG